MNPANKVSFPQLDILRFVAAFMIITLHAYEGWCAHWGTPGFMSNGSYKGTSALGAIIGNIIENFRLGVDVFFLISGFLITYLLLIERERFGKVDIRKFYIRRILRIWPLYFFLIAIAPFIIQWMQKPQPDYLSNILFINNFKTIQTHNWEYPFAHFWSICVEEHFYLVWPLLIALIPTKRLPVFFTLLILSSIVFRGISYLHNPTDDYTIFLHTLSRCDVLSIGAIIAYIHHRKPIVLNIHPLIRIVVYSLFIVVISKSYSESWNSLFMVCFKKYFYCSVFAFGIANYLFNPKSFFRFRKQNVFHYFGKVSYGIYMYGNILVGIVIEKIMLQYHLSNMYFYILIVCSASILIPILSYELFEKHFLKLKSKFQIVNSGR